MNNLKATTKIVDLVEEISLVVTIEGKAENKMLGASCINRSRFRGRRRFSGNCNYGSLAEDFNRWRSDALARSAI